MQLQKSHTVQTPQKHSCFCYARGGACIADMIQGSFGNLARAQFVIELLELEHLRERDRQDFTLSNTEPKDKI